MGATGLPYSDVAMRHAKERLQGKLLTGWQELEMGAAAMHDRSALGLDASVHAGSYRQELLRELADSFRAAPVDLECEDVALFAMETRARIRREVVEEIALWVESEARQCERVGEERDGETLRLLAERLREFAAVEVPDGQ